MVAEQMTCPRRTAEHGFMPGPDEWQLRDGVHCCSFCGSMHPADFFGAIDRGRVLNTTYKTYKVYVIDGSSRQWKFYFHHLSEEQRDRFVDLYNSKKIAFGELGLYTTPFFAQKRGDRLVRQDS